MKRALRFFAWITMLILVIAALSVNAAELKADTGLGNSSLISIEYSPDGGYIETRIGEQNGGVQPFASTYTKTGYKTKAGYDSSGAVIWKRTIYGIFSINPGVSSTCIDTWYVSECYGSWQQSSASSSRTTSVASGTATYVRKVLFITVETVNVSVSISYDKNGTFSQSSVSSDVIYTLRLLCRSYRASVQGSFFLPQRGSDLRFTHLRFLKKRD